MVAVQPAAGRRDRRQQRRIERAEELASAPPVFEFVADHPDGGECAHRGPRELVQTVADSLRADGWRVTWLPVRFYSYGTIVPNGVLRPY